MKQLREREKKPKNTSEDGVESGFVFQRKEKTIKGR